MKMFNIEDWAKGERSTTEEIIKAGHFIPADSKATFETVEDMVIISVKKLQEVLNTINQK